METARRFSGLVLVARGCAVFAGLFAVLAAITATTGQRFQLVGRGSTQGMPLPTSWFHAGLLAAVGLALWFLAPAWDAPAFVAFRAKRRWVVPIVSTFVLFPLFIVALFMLVR